MLEKTVSEEISGLINADAIKDSFSIQLAYSGGLDSSCLLHVLVKLKKYFNFKLFATYVNYGTSSYSLQVLDNLNKIHSDIITSSMDAQINTNENFESKARDIRYSFLSEISNKYNINYTFTAHHYDDQIETLAMKFIDNNDLVGMQGIRKRTDFLCRPILEVSKKEIINYVNKYKINYFEDPTNKDISFKRNKIRKVILPSLLKDSFLLNRIEEINKKSILEFEKLKREVNAKIKTLTLEEYSKFKLIFLDTNHIKNKDIVYVKLLFKSILRRYFNQERYDRNKKFWMELLNFIINSKTGALFTLSSKVNILKDRENVIIFDEVMLREKAASRLKIYKRVEVSLGDIEVFQNCDRKASSKSEHIVDKSKFKKGIFIRNWRYGDKIYFNYGSKKVSDLFTDFKLPSIKKEIYPIIEDCSGEIIWIPEMFSKKTKSSRNRVLLKWNN